MAILEVRNLKKYIQQGLGNQVQALADLNFPWKNYVAIRRVQFRKDDTAQYSGGVRQTDGREVLLNNEGCDLGERRFQIQKENLGFVFKILICWIIFSLKITFFCHLSWQMHRCRRWRSGFGRLPKNWDRCAA